MRSTLIPASHLLVLNGRQLILLRRRNTGFQDGNYGLPAGHVEQGESAVDCMIREAKEEIGIGIQKEDIFLVHVMHRRQPDEQFDRINFFFQNRDLVRRSKKYGRG